MASKKVSTSPRVPIKPSTSRKKPPLSSQVRESPRTFEDPVNEASDESFPASDPPAWTQTAASKDGQ